MIAVFRGIKSVVVYVAIFAMLLCVNGWIASTEIRLTCSPMDRFVVVIDAGHGGIDSGCIGASTGATESEINLNISQKIGKNLEAMGIGVVYTRRNSDGLYGTFASGHKMRDMRAREKIIKQANPNLVISIHLNSFTSPTPRGAQVFYKIDNEISKELAEALQELFSQKIEGSDKVAKPGDFYILNYSPSPGVLVECGFLSNVDEEALLITDAYQEKIAYIISCGVIAFLV